MGGRPHRARRLDLWFLGDFNSSHASRRRRPRRQARQAYRAKGATGRYICLSHCWGTVKIIRTTKTNLEKYKEAIVWAELSKTFREAIELTREFGLGFIWIDSLCIVQDGPQDWNF